MSWRRNNFAKAALSMLHYSGIDNLVAPLTRGAGVIFTLHHVRPSRDSGFDPNGILSVTPEFLKAVVDLVVDRGFDVISLDDLHDRLVEGELERPFASFTFDDGYKDNRDHAYPIFRRRGLPFAMYVATEFADGRGELWWLALERIIAAVEVLDVKMQGEYRQFRCRTAVEKSRAFARIYWWLRRVPERHARQVVAHLTRVHVRDRADLCRELVMNWAELRAFAADPLVTIGAHTCRHYALARLPHGEARMEMEQSARRIENELGQPCRHFSFPYGDESSAGPREFDLARELGFKTAVTTRKGLIHSHHNRAITALPRVSLNGDFQQSRYVKAMLTGAPFALLTAAKAMRPRAEVPMRAGG
jgi:peptidoglycan/xylan/chitin deacetylase (PgdA/CDA1 family)